MYEHRQACYSTCKVHTLTHLLSWQKTFCHSWMPMPMPARLWLLCSNSHTGFLNFWEYDVASILSYNHHQMVQLHPSVFLSDQRIRLYTNKQHTILGLGLTCSNVAYLWKNYGGKNCASQGKSLGYLWSCPPDARSNIPRHHKYVAGTSTVLIGTFRTNTCPHILITCGKTVVHSEKEPWDKEKGSDTTVRESGCVGYVGQDSEHCWGQTLCTHWILKVVKILK
jgi:hypothetical protein